MKRAVFYGDEIIKIDEVPEPLPGPGQVKMEVAYCGICGSDVNRFFGPYIQGYSKSYNVKNEPVAMGHEVSGIIREIGAGVQSVKPGDRVVLQPVIYCGECDNCRNGDYNLCRDYGMVGSACDGGMSEYIIVPERNVYPIPDDMHLLKAALIPFGAFAFGTVMSLGLKKGATCFFAGASSTGLMAVQAASRAGAEKIIVSDRSKIRLDMALKMGATDVINILEENVKDHIMDITGSRGVDYAVDSVGLQSTVNEVFEAVRYNGTAICMFNDFVFDEYISVPRDQLMIKQVNLRAFNSPYINLFPTLIDFAYKGIMNSNPLVTKIIGLEDIVEEGFRTLEWDKSQIKIAIKVHDLD